MQSELVLLTSARVRERLAVVARVDLVDVRRPVGGELGPRDVDPVLERATDVVVDRHVRLVLQDGSRSGGVGELGRRHGREVPRGASVAGRAEDVEGARLVGVGAHGATAVEHLAAHVCVALGVPGDGGVAARLPVLARGTPGGRPVRERHRDEAVGPGPTAVARECADAVAVAAAVVVLARDHLARVHRVDGDGLLVLRLAATGQGGVGDVLAGLVDLDVVTEALRASSRT